MKKLVFSTVSRSLFCKHRMNPCVYIHKCARHYSDKVDDKRPVPAKVEEKKADSIDQGLNESKTVRYSYNNAEAPSGYEDPASTDEHYHIKRACRLLKLEGKKVWNQIQDPGSRYQGASLFPTHVDILIVGGGAIGSSIAYFLKEKVLSGCRVAVVDRDFTVNYDLTEVKY